MDSKNKLVRAISADELQGFLDELARTPSVDGPMIQKLAEEKFGVEMGHNSANHFRKEVYQKFLDRLSKRKQMASLIATHKDDASGKTLADAASDELQQQVFEFLTENEALDLSAEAGLAKAESLARIIKSARGEDRKMIKDLQLTLNATKEKINELKDPTKADSAAARAAILEEVDAIMGVKK
jgi:hypothetical protein